MEKIAIAIKDCGHIFQDTIEIWALLHEDPHVQKIEAKIQDKQLLFAPVQKIARLQEGTLLQGQIYETQRKAQIISLWT